MTLENSKKILFRFKRCVWSNRPRCGSVNKLVHVIGPTYTYLGTLPRLQDHPLAVYGPFQVVGHIATRDTAAQVIPQTVCFLRTRFWLWDDLVEYGTGWHLKGPTLKCQNIPDNLNGLCLTSRKSLPSLSLTWRWSVLTLTNMEHKAENVDSETSRRERSKDSMSFIVSWNGCKDSNKDVAFAQSWPSKP